jgi:hypothetical protein
VKTAFASPWRCVNAFFFGKESWQITATNGDSSPFVCRIVQDVADAPGLAEANAKQIVKCVNNHGSLIFALNSALDRLYEHTRFGVLTQKDMEAMENARAALKAAEDHA